MPTWILLSLLFPILFGMGNIVDKLIVDRYAPSIFLYAFWIGVFEIVLASTFFVTVTGIQGIDSEAFAGGMLTGGIRSVSVLLTFAALKRGQVARIVPIWYLYPLMVAPMAVGFLDESLSALAWGAILMAVLGGVLVSWQGGTGGDGGRFGDPAGPLLALAAAATFAVSLALSKHFLTEDNLFQFYGPTRLGFALGVLTLILLPEVRRGALGTVKNRGFVGLLALGEVVFNGSTMMNLAAISLGPVSLVTAISAIQPGLVFLYCLGLASLFPVMFGGWISRGTLRTQVTGIAVITAAVVIIALL